ncbi:MAG: ABC transporter substrate-binding protein [Candidatus Limnocylindria bacterium]
MPSTGPMAWRRAGVLLGSLALALAACSPGATSDASVSAGAEPSDGGDGEIGEVVMLSSQLVPVEEQEKMRNTILADFTGEAEFIGADSGPFNDRIRAEGETGSGDVSLIGGLHGEFGSFAADDLLMDLSDVAAELADLGINEQYLELGKLGTDQQLYIPWMQATYIMAARSEAMQYLPDGADIDALTWDQVTEWGANIEEATGERKLGFPAGEEGLWHRFFQGYAYPAFTGGLNTAFATDDAVAMWDWLADTWQYVNPQATTYGFMQEPLQSGEVWVAWDHTARLIEALRNQPDDMVAFPAPAGPSGRAFMPVVAGLAIPNSAANPDGAKELIKYLLQPATQATTLSEVSFFPVITADLPGDLEPGQQAEEAAVTAMTNASDALPSLLPIGLGDQGGAYNQVFRDAFQQIVLDGQDAAGVLETLAGNLQEVLDTVEAACWPPDPESDGTCQVQ